MQKLWKVHFNYWSLCIFLKFNYFSMLLSHVLECQIRLVSVQNCINCLFTVSSFIFFFRTNICILCIERKSNENTVCKFLQSDLYRTIFREILKLKGKKKKANCKNSETLASYYTLVWMLEWHKIKKADDSLELWNLQRRSEDQ